jgi:hypothetical protein
MQLNITETFVPKWMLIASLLYYVHLRNTSKIQSKLLNKARLLRRDTQINIFFSEYYNIMSQHSEKSLSPSVFVPKFQA